MRSVRFFTSIKQKKQFVRVTTICMLKPNMVICFFLIIGVARGCGWQKIGACVNLGSYYLVGVPLGLLLGFHLHLGGRVRLNKKTREILNVTAIDGSRKLFCKR